MATESRLQARITFLEAILHNNGFCKDGNKCTLKCSQNQPCGRILGGKIPMLAQSVGLFGDWTLYDPEVRGALVKGFHTSSTHYDPATENQYLVRDANVFLYQFNGDAPSNHAHVWIDLGQVRLPDTAQDIKALRASLPAYQAASKTP